MLQLLAEHERLGAQLAVAIAAVEADGGWTLDGSASFAAWLRHEGRLSVRDAAAWQRRGRFLRRFPAVADAACSRALSHSQVGFLHAACPAALEPILDEQQEAMVTILAPLGAADTQLACSAWRTRAEALIDSPLPAEPERVLRMGRDDDGTVVGTFVLPAQAGAEFEQAIRTALTWDGADESRHHGERSADALFEIAAFYNKNHDVPGTPRHRPHIELSLDASTLHDVPLATDADGRLVDPFVTETLLCHCAMHQIRRDGDAVLAYGRARYTVPKTLFRAVAARDGGCRFPAAAVQCASATLTTSATGGTAVVRISTTWSSSSAVITTLCISNDLRCR